VVDYNVNIQKYIVKKFCYYLNLSKKSEIYLKYDEDLLKISYMKWKDKIEMIWKQFVFKFNKNNKYDDEKDNLK
jgi:hypothetical protein